MISQDIKQIESDLSIAKKIAQRDETALNTSDTPLVDRIFFSSSKKRQLELEHELFLAKTEKAHELVSVRLIGNQMDGSIRLKSLLKIVEPLNTLIERSAWKFWDKEGNIERIDEGFSNLIDLRLAAVESGSTELLILGNTSPDLTGDSALEEGLKNVFKLLCASNDEFSDTIHDVGLPACKALSTLMDVLEKQHLATELTWFGPSEKFSWEGRPQDITRIRSILDDIGEPTVEEEVFRGIVQVLSVRNRVEIYRPDTESKMVISYHRSLADDINELHLGDQRQFVVEKTIYPFHVAKKKKDAYTLKSIHLINLSDDL
jgi:hypothetical protein